MLYPEFLAGTPPHPAPVHLTGDHFHVSLAKNKGFFYHCSYTHCDHRCHCTTMHTVRAMWQGEREREGRREERERTHLGFLPPMLGRTGVLPSSSGQEDRLCPGILAAHDTTVAAHLGNGKERNNKNKKGKFRGAWVA